MRRRLPILLLASALTLPAWAQTIRIPWQPQSKPAPKTGKRAGPKLPGAAARFKLTFDKVQTVSPGVYFVQGNVRFSYPGLVLTCDALTYDSNKETLWATGDVTADFQDFTLSGSELHYNLKTDTGTMEDAYGVDKAGRFVVQGKQIKKTGPDWFEVIKGRFSSCNSAEPPWSIRISRARLHIDHYAHMVNPRFHVRRAPVLYLPYLIWPIKPDRSTGLLFPQVGNSTLRGFTMSNALYLAPQSWWDDTIYLDHFQYEGYGFGEEFRYALTPQAFGWLHGYYIKQKSDDQKRWDFAWTHVGPLFNGKWELAADVNLVSDSTFWRDYMRDYYQGTNPNADSVIYLYREWGPYALNFKLQRQFQFYGSRNLTEERLPGVEWRSTLQDLGHGLYGGFVMSADAFRKQWFASTGAPFTKDSLDYQRVDIHPSLEWPAHPAPWLDITPRLELRGTYYTKSQGTGGPDDYTGGAILRRYGVLGLDISGPRLYRNYGGGTLRHIIEPFVDFQVVSADSRASKIPLLDQVDRVALDQRTVTYGIRNRLYGTDHRLILDSELSQTYSQNRDLSFFGPKSSPYSPVSLTLRTWPTEHLNADLRLRYNILSHQLDSKSLSASYSRGGNFARMTYLESKAAVVDPSLALDPAYDFTQTTGLGLPATYSMLPATKEIQFSAALSIWKKRISITPSIDRDLLTGDWRNQHLFLWYNGSCYSLGLEAGRRQIGAFRDSEYRFMVRLKNVGTALDLHGSTGAYAQ